MISTVSILLVLMLTIGANPAYIDTSSSVINPQSTTGKININQKPRLGVKKNFSGIKGKNNPVNAGTIYKKENKKSNSRRGSYYGYNNVHMKTYEQRGHENNAGDVYTYDDVYRLTNVKINVPDPTVPNPTEFEKEKTFNFDKLDNILSIVETQNEQTVTKTTQINSILNQYENFDGWGLSYDLNGNTTQKGTQHFTYNYRNQVIKAQDQTTEANYKYDALGRRVQKAVTVGSATKTTNYYYSGNHVIEERDGSDNVLNQYIYENGIDEIIRMDKYTGTNSTPYYFHTNGIGSVTAITDANGDVVERVSYDIFGMPTFTDAAGEVISNSTIGNTLLFHGRRYDAETNLYFYRARYFDPIMGRFLQTDPKGYYDSMNMYQSFNQNPVNFTDPMGEYFVVPNSDPEKDRILNALAIGALTSQGKIFFWRIFTDRRPVIIHSGSLFTTLKPQDMFRRTRGLIVKQTYGRIDSSKALRNWKTDKQVNDLDVTISFKNLDNYFLLKRRFGYQFVGQGNLDKDGITTIYHELYHVRDYLNLDRSLPAYKAHLKVRDGDMKVDSSGNIIKPRIFSSNSRAQLFGELVFKQSKSLTELEKMKVQGLINLIINNKKIIVGK